MKAYIIDDESLAIENLNKRLLSVGKFSEIKTFLDPFLALGNYQTDKPDIIFIDIQMPGISGIELAEKFVKVDANAQIVFVTAYSNYGVEAFEVEALDYLLKPVSEERLKVTLDRYYKKQATLNSVKEQAKRKIKLKIGNALIVETEEKTIETIEWRTNKAQELFLYLLQHRGDYVERDAIIETLWFDKDLESATALLYTNISYVRKGLEGIASHIQIKNHMNGYLLKLTDCIVDVLDWEEEGKELPNLTTENVQTYEAYVKRFNGKYLERFDFSWIEAKRAQLVQLWKGKISELVYFYEEQEKYQRAIQLLNDINQQSVEVDETFYFLLMKLYQKLNNLDAIAKQYSELVYKLDEQLGLGPSIEVEEWYKQNVLQKFVINLNEIYEK